MNYPESLPTIETNSFYELFKSQESGQEADSARDRREYVTTYRQFVHKPDGSCDVVTHNFEGRL